MFANTTTAALNLCAIVVAVAVALLRGASVADATNGGDVIRVPAQVDGLEPRVTLMIGTPAKSAELLFDTGSGILFDNTNDGCQGYNPSASSSAETTNLTVTYNYGGGKFGFTGLMNTDVVSAESGFDVGRTLAIGAGKEGPAVDGDGPCAGGSGIVGTEQNASIWFSFFENNPDVENYFVTNFNIWDVGSYFEVGTFPTEDAAEEPFCVPSLQTDAISLFDNTKNQTKYWMFEIESASLGDYQNITETQAMIDSGTSSVGGNFASIFGMDNQTMEDICGYMKENNATLEVTLPTGSISLSYDDVYIPGEDGDPSCILKKTPFPGNVILFGIQFYNKYLIQHGPDMCFATKSRYTTYWNAMSTDESNKTTTTDNHTENGTNTDSSNSSSYGHKRWDLVVCTALLISLFY